MAWLVSDVFELANKRLNTLSKRPQHRGCRAYPAIVLALVGHYALGLHLLHGDALVDGRNLLDSLPLIGAVVDAAW